MPTVPIESLDDPRLDIYRDLPNRHTARRTGRFIAEGQLLVERLLASDLQVESVLVERSRLENMPPLFDKDPTVLVIPSRMVEQIVGFNFHRGIMACGFRPPVTDGNAWLTSLPTAARLVVAVDVQDPENLGAVIRNCAAFGIDGCVLTPQSADPFSRRVLRVSMGTVFRLPVPVSHDLPQQLLELRRRHSFQLIGTVLDASAEPLTSTAPVTKPPWAMLLGNEASGLPADIVALCDRRVTIAMHGGTDSLNVAVASGIFLYRFTR